MKSSKCYFPSTFLACLLVSGIALFGQTTAEIAGTVTDSTGAVIPGVSLTITNVETGVSRTTETNQEGYYVVTLLQPGSYRVAAQQQGFRPLNRSGITLHIAERAVVDLTLELGAVTEEVSVTADAPLLETTTAAQGQVIDNQRIVDLPLNGRDYIQLALLSAGTNAPPGNARFSTFTSSGMRASQNNFLLDGVDNNSLQRTGQGRQAETVKPSIDAIQEFKVLTNSFSAEYGRAAGGVVSVSLKSGTNALHGSAYNFLRNEKLDAKNFFDKPDAPRVPFKRNQFGFALGGPIIKNKTFFFGDYEGTRIRESRTVNTTVPTALQAGGDFSERLPGTTIYDPATYNAETGLRQPFAGNVIPSSRFDAVGAQLASFYPAPNRPGLTQNYLVNPPDNENVDRWDAKIDHTLNEKNNLFGRFSYQLSDLPASPNLPPPAFGGGDPSSNFRHDGQNFVLAYNRVFSPTLIWSAKAAWNRIYTARTPSVDENLNATLLNLPGVDQQNPGMAAFSLSGFSTIGIGNFNPNLVGTQSRQIVSDLTWVRGKHTLKSGISFQWLQHFLNNSQQAHGQFSFDTSFTRNSDTLKGGSPLADMLLGHPITAQTSNFIWENSRTQYYDFYVQDEWRVTQRLTLNLGVRYELHLPWVDKLNKIGNTDISDFLNPVIVPAVDGSRFSRSTVHTDSNNFGPRFGFAYRATNKMVLRGGYGIYHGNAVWKPMLLQNPPFHFKAGLTTNRITPELQLADGLPEGIVSAENASRILVETQEVDWPSSYAQQWNFSIQHELPGDMVVEVGYYANTTRKLMRQYDVNQPPPAAGNKNARRPQQRVFVPGPDRFITLAKNRLSARSANANFNSLQVRVEKRLSHGLSLMSSYIWSKTISDGRGSGASGGVAPIEPQDPFNLRAERSLADEHIPHRFVTSAVYELPFGRGKAYLTDANAVVDGLLGGWTMAGIVTLSSGVPASLRVRGNPSNASSNDRPNVLRDWRLSGSQRSLNRWFDTEAFEANQKFTFGNAARNLIQRPGLGNLDFAVYKSFRITERMRLQFRAEAFNMTNTPHFGAPNTQFGNPSFGRITGAGRPRNLQFGLKLIF